MPPRPRQPYKFVSFPTHGYNREPIRPIHVTSSALSILGRLILAIALAIPLPAFATRCADCPVFATMALDTVADHAPDDCCGGCHSGVSAAPTSDDDTPAPVPANGSSDCQKSCGACCAGRPLVASPPALSLETAVASAEQLPRDSSSRPLRPTAESIFHPPKA